VNFRDLIRGGVTDEALGDHLIKVVGKRAKDGFEAEKSRSATLPASESMATIGG
jgi:cyclic pyranopterin phosphate synthase